MMLRSLPLAALALLLAGCPTSDDDDSAAHDPAGPSFAVATTTDFGVGALASVDVASLTITDEITALSGDPVVFADGGLVFQLNRQNFDSVRVYDPAQLTAPILEFSTGAGSNPHQAALCDGAIFVTRYNTAELGVYDVDSGLPIDTIDLSSWADPDGLPEMSTMVRRGDTLYVGLERLTREGIIWPPSAGGGRVLEIDCATRAVTREWITGNNVQVHPHPTDPDTLWLVDGMLLDQDDAPFLDGGVRTLSLDLATPGPYELTDAAVGGNLIGLAVGDDGRGILVTNDATHHHVHCLNTDGWTTTLHSSHLSWSPGVFDDGEGRGWVLFRSGSDPLVNPAGIAVFDLATCEETTDGAWLTTSLEPYSLAFF